MRDRDLPARTSNGALPKFSLAFGRYSARLNFAASPLLTHTHTHTHIFLFHSNARRPRPPRCRPRRCPPPASACCGPSSRASSPASTPLSPSRSPRAAETADQPQIQYSHSSCSRLTTGLDGASRAVSTSIPPPTTPLGPRLSTSGPRGPPPATGHHHRLSRRLSCPSPSPQGPYTSQLLSQPRPPHLPASRLAG
jgi:hypothetical protein